MSKFFQMLWLVFIIAFSLSFFLVPHFVFYYLSLFYHNKFYFSCKVQGRIRITWKVWFEPHFLFFFLTVCLHFLLIQSLAWVLLLLSFTLNCLEEGSLRPESFHYYSCGHGTFWTLVFDSLISKLNLQLLSACILLWILMEVLKCH